MNSNDNAVPQLYSLLAGVVAATLVVFACFSAAIFFSGGIPVSPDEQTAIASR